MTTTSTLAALIERNPRLRGGRPILAGTGTTVRNGVHLQHATDQGRILCSFNRGDFFSLHTQWLSHNQHHTGIIVSDQLATSIVSSCKFGLTRVASAG